MKKKILLPIIISLIALGLFFSLTIISRIFKGADLPIQVTGAFLGAIVTAFITMILLHGQSGAEEVKERNVKVFEKKVENFIAFIELLWDKWEDFKIEPDEFSEIKKTFYSKIYIYMQKKNLEQIKKCFQKISSEEVIGKDLNEEERKEATKNIFEIISILKSEIGLEKDYDIEILSELDSIFTRGEYASEISESAEEEITQGNLTKLSFWHFIAMNETNQTDWLKRSTPILVLGDGEGDDKHIGPRTNLLTCIKKGHLTFLYFKGKGYVGIFRATEDGKSIPVNGERLLIQGYGSEGHLPVEPVVFFDKGGAGYDIVRRRTIQRVPSAEKILNLFVKKYQNISQPIPKELEKIIESIKK